jgi:hypothetical protein
MARPHRSAALKAVRAAKGSLVSVDGVDAAAVMAAARAALGARSRGGISRWDASGIFQELAVADAAAGVASARTLLLLYAADLAFRLRWQIRPALAEGRTVVAAPYVETAIAFGRAFGLKAGWLTTLFRFAPRAADRRFAHTARARTLTSRDGFVGVGCDHLTGPDRTRQRRQLVARTSDHLRRSATRANAPKRTAKN